MSTTPARVPDRPTPLPALLTTDLDIDTGQARRTAGDWIVDTACFLLALWIGAGQFAALAAQQVLVPEPVLLAGIATAALGCVGLWWRRRYPVTLAVAIGLSCVLTTLPWGAALVALFTVSAHRRFSIAAPIAALYVLSLLLLFVRMYPVAPEAPPYWTVLGLNAVVVAAVTAWGMFVRARRQLVVSLRDRADRAEAEQALRAEQERQAERGRIAREMHDVLAHRLSLLSTYAGALEYRHQPCPEELTRAAGVIRDSAHRALQDLREVIGVLRDDPTGGGDSRPDPPQPTLADIPALIEESRRAGMRVHWTSRLDPDHPIPETAGRNAYRIVQEGLTNACKHAPASTVTVTAEPGLDTGLTVQVSNPLPRVDQAGPWLPGAGSGLVGLAERVALAGGRLEHGTTDNGEFRLRAWLP